jgi:hypothetical protein
MEELLNEPRSFETDECLFTSYKLICNQELWLVWPFGHRTRMMMCSETLAYADWIFDFYSAKRNHGIYYKIFFN